MVEPAARRRELALVLGADAAIAPDEFASRRAEVLPHGADIVVDAVGSVLPDAIAAAATGGRIILVGMNSRARADVGQNELTRRRLSILGSYVTHFTFPPAIDILERGLPDLSPVVTHVLPLERVADGLALIADGEAIKVAISLDGSPA